ncbi:MAG: transcription elongation factor GreA [Chloroflexia bacterium]|nr:transcription elongation factor GreA [Chloroflexia bacterium]
MTEPTYLTPEGQKKLQKELDHLRTEGRRHAAKRLQHAIELGDLRESGEYQDAKEHQAFIEGRIRELELLLADVELIDETENSDRVILGSTVCVRDQEGYEETWLVVGSAEADPSGGRISDESPVGRALMGGRVRDTVQVKTPAGPVQYTILEIS